MKTHHMLQSAISLDLTGQDLNLTGRFLFLLSPPAPSVFWRRDIFLCCYQDNCNLTQLGSRVFTSSNLDGHVSRHHVNIEPSALGGPGAEMEADIVVANDEQHLALKAVQSWSIRP